MAADARPHGQAGRRFRPKPLLRDKGGTGTLFQSPKQISGIGTDDGTMPA